MTDPLQESVAWDVRSLLHRLRAFGFLRDLDCGQVRRLEQELVRFALMEARRGEGLGKRLEHRRVMDLLQLQFQSEN